MTNYPRHYQDNLVLPASSGVLHKLSGRHQNDVIRNALGDVIINIAALGRLLSKKRNWTIE